MQGLRKHHILRGYQAFSRVLTQGQTKTIGSIRCFYLSTNGPDIPPRVGFAVIRSIRTAALRNRAKRLMREAFRLNRKELFSGGRGRISEVVFLYTGKERKHLRFPSVEREMVALLKKIQERI